MQSDEQNIWILLTRVLSGEADSTEIIRFNRWLEEDQGNRAFFEDLKTHWKEDPDGNTVNNRFMFDHESGISRLRYKIRDEKEEKAYQTAPSSAISNKKLNSWTIAASIILMLGLISAWVGIRSWSPEVTTYKTSSIEQRIITLPDKSTVRLNRNSAISFLKDFSGSSRKITLSGEAFFDVKHDANKPFIIHIGDAVVRDIGTSFNVKQQRDGKVVVAMKEGKASLRNKDASRSDASLLTKNQIGILNKRKVSAITQEEIQNYISWINGRLVFNDMRFDRVIRQLDNIYGIRSTLEDTSLATLNLTAYTNNTSLDEVLEMIALSLDIHYRKEGQSVVWGESKSSPETRTNNITDTTATKD